MPRRGIGLELLVLPGGARGTGSSADAIFSDPLKELVRYVLVRGTYTV